jgi:Domain of unknown function (DUF4314)
MLSKWKDSPLVGKRVRLEHTTDPYTKLRPGDEGVVDFIDDAGTIFVKWDDGAGLGLVRGEDRFTVVS